MGARLWVFGGVLVAAAGAGLAIGRLSPLRFAALSGAGLLAWTIVEYLLHRVMFHGFAPHSEHHADPVDPVYIVAPWWLSGSASLVLFVGFWLVAGSWTAGASILSGVIAGYLAYEGIHLRIHSPAAGGSMLRALRKHHYYHHFADDQVCYGVTSPLWDWIFRSVPKEESGRR